MVDQPSRIPPTQKATESSRVDLERLEAKHLAEHSMERVFAEQDFQSECNSGFDGIAIRRNFKTLEEFKARKARAKEAQKQEEEEEITTQIIGTEKAEETATRFQNKNFELNKKTLLLLRDSLKQSDKYNDIIRKVLDFYSDPTLADEALDFLYETTYGDLQKEVLKAKEELNARCAREIKAGKNIKTEAKEFSKAGLGSPTGLRDLYRDITGKARTAHELFDDLAKKFSYEQLKTAIKFLFHSLGSDLKAKGPSISRAELLKLIEDTKILQAILGVYKFFEGRMNLVTSQFLQYSLKIPPSINFETLSKLFVKLLEARYVSPEKILQNAALLGIAEELLAQIIVFNQFRDAIRNTSPKLYRSDKHRQEVIDAILEALEEIEEEYEEEEGEEK